MAFQRDKYNNFFQLLKRIQSTAHPEEQAIADNFILEERLTDEREDSYATFLISLRDLDDLKFDHENYVARKVKIPDKRKRLQETPETFSSINTPNLLPEIEQDQYLVRVENLVQLAKVAQYEDDINLLVNYFENFIKNPKNKNVADIVKDFLLDCNRNRDLRPSFVGFWGEVKDLLEQNDDDWANKLRDRFGIIR